MSWPNIYCEEILDKCDKRMRRRGINQDDVDDIMQDVRLHVFKNAKKDAAYAEMNRWVYILANFRMQKHFDMNRKHRDIPLPQHDSPIELDGGSIDMSDKGKEEKRMIDKLYAEQVISGMSPNDAEAFWLRAEGMAWPEAIRQSGSVSKARMYERREALRRKHEPR